MGQSIDNALVTQFSDMVHIEAQQMQSRMKPYIKWRPMTGDNWAYDSLGTVESIETSGRNIPVQFADILHSRRKIERKRFYVALPIDGYDKLGMLIDPNTEYRKAVVYAMMRRVDRVVTAAATASIQTGRDFSTTVSATSDGVLNVDATGGLTYEKLLEVNRNFTDNEVGNDVPVKKLFAITGKEEEALMKESELTSGDFTRQFAVEKGQMVNAAGLDLIKYGASATHPILALNTGGTQRTCLSIAEGGICVGVSKELELKIQERPDLVDTYQIIAYFYMGAVRTEGKLVQTVTTTV